MEEVFARFVLELVRRDRDERKGLAPIQLGGDGDEPEDEQRACALRYQEG